MNRTAALAGIVAAAALLGCASSDEPEPSAPPGFLDEPFSELPATIEELGLYPDPADRTGAHPKAMAYDTAHPLWSSGSLKQRYIVLPPGESIDPSSPDAWSFPDGTLFAKTFSYPGAAEAGAERPIETRIIRWLDGEVEYAVYRWDDAGTSAALTAIDRPIRVAVSAFGESFEHVIPARLDCRKCHESQPVRVLGFDELGLAEPPVRRDSEAPVAAASLDGWVELGVLSAAPAEPRLIRHEDALTQSVLGYIEGNCTHCHNGGTEASASYDLRYTVALESLIDRDTEGEALSGLRIASGDPEQSALFLALRREDRDGIQPMPPVGVERRDEAAIELFGEWISSLAAPP
jgi:hypothetical protein